MSTNIENKPKQVAEVCAARPVGAEEMFPQTRPIDRRRRCVGQRCSTGVGLDCWEGELVGFAVCEQAADLVEFASELVSLISDQVESLAWDVWGVLDGAPVDICEPVAFEVTDASAGERAERAVEVAVDDELGALVYQHEALLCSSCD